jgi:methionyl-tRNA formyltransferase
MSWRVVIVTRIPPVLAGFDAVVRAAGHEPVAFLTMRNVDGRYGPPAHTGELVMGAAGELDVLLPARRSTIAPLLASVQPDLVVCMGFPWKVPREALAVPPLGWLNSHPSLLPRHRGPVPIAWAIRGGDDEFGITFHRMEPELDSGAILAQRVLPVGEYCEPDDFYGRMGPVVIELFREALGALAAGEEGRPQPDGGEYESFFTDDDAYLDPVRSALELHRLVWAWRYTIPRGELQGALLERDGETVRVLASSLQEAEGAERLDCADGPLWLLRTEPVQEQSRETAHR